MFRNLRAYLEALERRGELHRIKVPVSAELEMAEIADRVVKRGGPALLFERVVGKDFPVAMGLFGTRERTAFALGVEDLDEVARKVEVLLALKPGKGGFSALLALLPKLPLLGASSPDGCARPRCRRWCGGARRWTSSAFPSSRPGPWTGGPSSPFPWSLPGTGDRGAQPGHVPHAGPGPKEHRHALAIAQGGTPPPGEGEEAGEEAPRGRGLGGDPVLTYAATAPLPPLPGVSEFHLAGFLRGAPVELARGVTIDLPVPAEAEFVLEGT